MENEATELFNTFRRLFGGRKNVYTIHDITPSGEQRRRRSCSGKGTCLCTEADCASCNGRGFEPFSEKAVETHLLGRRAVGIYPADERGLCRFALIELGEDGLELRMRLLAAACAGLGLTHLCELTHFKTRGRLWILFGEELPARAAAAVGGRIITELSALTGTGYGDLLECVLPSLCAANDMGEPVVLPLFHAESGYSVFVSDSFDVIENPKEYLENIRPEGRGEFRPIMPDETDFPKRIDAELCNKLYVKTEGMTDRGIASLCRLATVLNSERSGEFLPRVPVLDNCATLSDGRISLPRATIKSLFSLVRPAADVSVFDSRSRGEFVRLRLATELDEWQRRGVKALLHTDMGLLTAPMGSGKTKIICAVMAELKRSTLVLTTERAAAVRWRKRLIEYLSLGEGEVGCVISDRDYPNGKIDVAALDGRTELRLAEYLPCYGLVVVADVDRIHCTAPVFKSVMEEICAERIYAVSTIPIDAAPLGACVKMYCGGIIYG